MGEIILEYTDVLFNLQISTNVPYNNPNKVHDNHLVSLNISTLLTSIGLLICEWPTVWCTKWKHKQSSASVINVNELLYLSDLFRWMCRGESTNIRVKPLTKRQFQWPKSSSVLMLLKIVVAANAFELAKNQTLHIRIPNCVLLPFSFYR